jgi:hypothetical protein
MMKVLLLQLDGKLPNLALMRITAHHRALGDAVRFRWVLNPRGIERGLWDDFDRVYASLIFERTLPLALRLREVYPDALIGGTGWSKTLELKDVGITTLDTDYAEYPRFAPSVGFVFRGCRLACSHCVVPQKEGRTRPEQTITEIWRGDPHPRNLLLLDNDFGGHSTWRDRAREIIDGQFKVSFFQGINARLMFEELAEALAAMDLRDGDFRERRLYTAWDSKPDEARLFAGLRWLVKYGLRPDDIMVYVLCGYCHRHEQAADLCPASCPDKDTHEDREYRRAKLREFGARPYPMPYVRTPELIGFQRWVVRRADLKMSWKEYAGAAYRPENVRRGISFPMFDSRADAAPSSATVCISGAERAGAGVVTDPRSLSPNLMEECS